MNKVFKMCFAASSSYIQLKEHPDFKIAVELLKKDQELRRHFYNIARYLGPRDTASTHKIFSKFKRGNSYYSLYVAVHGPLSMYLKEKMKREWEPYEIGLGEASLPIDFPHLEEAMESIKFLMEE